MAQNDDVTECIAVNAYIKNEKSSVTRELAKTQMLQKASYKKSIMWHPEEQPVRVANVTALGAEFKARDDECANAAKCDGTKYQHLFTPHVEGKQRGTEYEIENLCRHISKGCNDFPLPMNEMYVNARPTVPTKGSKLMPLMSLQGSSGCESTNWQVLLAVFNVSRMHVNTAHMCLDKRFHIFNRDKDAVMAHLTGKIPKSLQWFLEEALLEDGGHVFVEPQFDSESFPAKLDLNKYNEPVGKEFLELCDSEKLDHELDGVLNDTVDFCT